MVFSTVSTGRGTERRIHGSIIHSMDPSEQASFGLGCPFEIIGYHPTSAPPPLIFTVPEKKTPIIIIHAIKGKEVWTVSPVW